MLIIIVRIDQGFGSKREPFGGAERIDQMILYQFHAYLTVFIIRFDRQYIDDMYVLLQANQKYVVEIIQEYQYATTIK